MTRYQILRRIGCDPFAAAVVAIVNWLQGHPKTEIHFLHMIVEVEL